MRHTFLLAPLLCSERGTTSAPPLPVTPNRGLLWRYYNVPGNRKFSQFLDAAVVGLAREFGPLEQQVGKLGVLGDVSRHKRALGNDFQSLRPCGLERSVHQS